MILFLYGIFKLIINFQAKFYACIYFNSMFVFVSIRDNKYFFRKNFYHTKNFFACLVTSTLLKIYKDESHLKSFCLKYTLYFV